MLLFFLDKDVLINLILTHFSERKEYEMDIVLMNIGILVLILLFLVFTYFFPFTCSCIVALIYLSTQGIANYYLVWSLNSIAPIFYLIFLFVCIIIDMVAIISGRLGLRPF